MTPEELDQILYSEESVAASSGFTRSVMDAVRRQASEPPPLLFPWLRFVAGVMACAVMALAGVVLLSRAARVLPAIPAQVLVNQPVLCFAMGVLLVSFGLAALPRLLHRL
jgi:hypothetical protein